MMSPVWSQVEKMLNNSGNLYGHFFKVWILRLCFMGLNLSNNQISKELDLNREDVHNMAAQLREGGVKKPRWSS